ncbi:hypothetical protein CVT26_010473 [Gymnopilus dilepis]|uniref:Uncharacterized protein n=1 Tax=Gymnopilus dilepis TaxID=231916 RepID=A0A409Y0F0_9AGAR|nr:hypothetical protein CVT26_010473 [Gymnopilus dilepis]
MDLSSKSSSTLATTQPDGLASPSATDIPQENSTNAKARPSTRSRIKYVFRGLAMGVLDLLHLLFIVFVYVIPGAIMLGVLLAISIGFSLAFISANGAVMMLTGNAILRTHLAHYTNNATAAYIGAVGSLIASLCMSLTAFILPHDENGQVPWFISLPMSVAYATLTGAIGSAVLRHNHVDLHGTDVLHATRAGAVGGAVLGPGLTLAMPIIVLGVGLILSPLFLAMKLGFRWVYVRVSESWDESTYKSSYCYTYGTCGDDPEIEEELAQIPQHLR